LVCPITKTGKIGLSIGDPYLNRPCHLKVAFSAGFSLLMEKVMNEKKGSKK
jgi:hypothetical protein